MVRSLIGLLTLLCVAVAGGCGSFAARGMNAEGVRLFQQSQYRESMQQFQQAIAVDPNNSDAYYNLAAAYHRLGKVEGRQSDLDQAERTYHMCLDRAPEHRDCYRGLAVLLVEENRTGEAFRLLEGWADRYPTSADARIELARMLGEFNDQKGAEAQLVRALNADPDNARAWAALGKIREEAGDRSQALTNYQRSLYLNRFQPDVSARVASLQALVGPTQAAVILPTESATQSASRDSLPRR